LKPFKKVFKFLSWKWLSAIVKVMSASIDIESEWNFRVFDKRLIVVKTKNNSVRKVAVFDVLTNLMFVIDVPDMISMQELSIDKEYLSNLRVYTAKNVIEIDKEFVNFFEALDIDQSIEDFIKAYWIYPSKIRFELVEIEEP
jgi:hypothetical protein